MHYNSTIIYCTSVRVNCEQVLDEAINLFVNGSDSDREAVKFPQSAEFFKQKQNDISRYLHYVRKYVRV